MELFGGDLALKLFLRLGMFRVFFSCMWVHCVGEGYRDKAFFPQPISSYYEKSEFT